MLYSQSHIEPILDLFFPSAPGFFLEIGCWDGEHFSQTAYLEREKGWTGLCVDPFPVHFENRRCQLCKKAISHDGAPRAFLKVSIDQRHGGDVSYLSGFADCIAAIHRPVIEQFCEYQELQIETITLQQLYDQYCLPQHIDFLSIDTEGSDLEILESIDFSRYSFGMIMFEHNFDQEVRRRAHEILSNHQYIRFQELELDDIYLRRAIP